jgi:O-antigen ligase
LKAIVFYIILGLVSTKMPWISVVFLYCVLIHWYIKNKKLFDVNALLGIVQICGLEFWGRLTDMDPYFPYELSKYLLFIYLVLFTVLNKMKLMIFPMVLFVIVLGYSIFYVMDGVNFARIISDSNGLIIILLAFAIFRNSRVRISTKNVKDLAENWLNYMIIGLAFVFIKTPNIENIHFTLGANYDATGGESSNQVATYLGLGAILMFFLIASQQKFSGFKLLDIFILIAFLSQCLLTFSRGGFIVAILLMLYLFFHLGSFRLSGKGVLIFTTVLSLIFTSFVFIDSKTNGMLMNRFNGETNATIIGRKDKTLNVVSSNRLEIIEENFEIFSSNLFGVGPSLGTKMRKDRFGTDYYDHTEPSRWLVEYGILGIILIILYLYVNLHHLRLRHPSNVSIIFSSFLVAMILLSSLTLLHSATRTFVSFVPLVVGIIKLKSNVATVNRGNKSPQKT